MNPGRKCRIALAMTALASYAACGDEPVVEASAPPIAYENPHTTRPAEAADPTALLEQTVATAPRYVPPRASRSVLRPRPAPPDAAPSAGGGDVWARLRDCENGGSYTSDPGDKYRGAYQFLPSTWESLGYTGDPADAPPHVQDAAARRLQARSGWLQWPRCARRLGLR